MGISGSKTKTTNEPWSLAQPYILKGLEQTQRVFDKVQPQTEKYGQMSFDTYGRVAPGAEAGIGRSQSLVNDTLAGKYLNSNPYLDSIISKQAGDIRNGVGAAFSDAGRYGSGMMGDTIADNIADASGKLRYQNFADERQNQMTAVGQSQDLMRGSQGLLEQAATLPWTGVQALNGGVRTASNGYGTTTTKSSDPMGTLVGLAGAGATAYASDERIKDVKRKFGETSQGLGIYDYEYKGSNDLQRGLLAQEVEREQPQAMGPTVNGIKTVNYDALGVPPPAGAMAVDYAGLQQQLPTIPAPRTWLDDVISPDTSTTKGKIGLLGHALMAAGSQPFQALGKGLLGIRAEQRERDESEAERAHREAVERRLASGAALDEEYKRAQIDKMSIPDDPRTATQKDHEYYMSLSPEGRRLYLESRAPALSDWGVSQSGQRQEAVSGAAAKYRAPSGGGQSLTPTARAKYVVDANAAIARGADPAKVRARLAEMGVQ